MFFTIDGLKNKKKWWAVFGILLIILAVVFLIFRGHFTAVPFFHEILSKP